MTSPDATADLVAPRNDTVTAPAARPGKRAARPEPKRAARPEARRSAAKPARVRAERPVKVTVPQVSALEDTTPKPAARAATRAHGPVRVAQPSTEILTPASGRRRAVRPANNRGALLRSLPSAPILAGVAALAVSAGGAVTVAGPTAAESSSASSSDLSAVASIGGQDAILNDRTAVVSRDSRRVARTEITDAKLLAKAEKAAAKRNQTLKTITSQADRQAAKIQANLWVMPLEGYRLSATFGMSSSLWSTVHTGLDFAAPSGTPLVAVANGTITEVGYDGSYGNKTVLTLEDGTEVWYCHQTSMDVSVGEEVVGGEVIGTVGSTGNSTGPHLHLEIRPGAGDPVNPYSALQEHGLTP